MTTKELRERQVFEDDLKFFMMQAVSATKEQLSGDDIAKILVGAVQLEDESHMEISKLLTPEMNVYDREIRKQIIRSVAVRVLEILK